MAKMTLKYSTEKMAIVFKMINELWYQDIQDNLKNKQKLEQLIPKRGWTAANKQVLSITSPQKINHTTAPPPLHKNV